MLPIKFGTQCAETRTDTFQARLSESQKVIKWSKGWAIMIIFTYGYSVVMYPFGSILVLCRFICLIYFLADKFALVRQTLD